MWWCSPVNVQCSLGFIGEQKEGETLKLHAANSRDDGK